MTETRHHTKMRIRWSAIGAAIAVTIGAGGLGIAQAAVSTGDKPVVVTIEPERILDTRADLGLAGKLFVGDPAPDLQVTGLVDVASGGQKVVVPNEAVGVLVNVTVIRPNRPGYLSLRPGGAVGFPTTSTVNFNFDTIEPNSATVGLNNGKIQVFLVDTISDAGQADVTIDVVGYTIDHNHDDRYYTRDGADAVARMFHHVAIPANVTGNATTLDHPDLNGNPDAVVAVSHIFRVRNLTAVGSSYDDVSERWTVYTEDDSTLFVLEEFAITYVTDRNA